MHGKIQHLLKRLFLGPNAIPISIGWLAAFSAGIRLWLMLSTHFTSEDFLITLRYANNLATGHGLVFNDHQWVLGTTTPLYTLILAALVWLGLPAAILGKVLNIAADAFLCIVMYRWVRALGGDAQTGHIAAFLACIFPLQMNWAVSGMETGLVTLGGTLLWTLALEDASLLWCIPAAVVVLIRWDALLIVFLILLQRWHRTRKLPLADALIILAVLAPFLVAAWHWYGTPLPGTAFAKSIVYGWRADHLANPLLRKLPQLPTLIHVFFLTPYGLAATIAVAIGITTLWPQQCKHIIWPLTWLVVYWGSFLTSRILLFRWYLVPPLPVLYMLGSFGIRRAFTRLEATGLKSHLKVIAAVGTTVIAVACIAVSHQILAHDQLVEDTVRMPMGEWLAKHARKSDVVMLEPIGYVGYYSGLKVLDVIGLVTPDVLRFYNSHSVYPPFDIARAYKPQWCILRPGELEHVRAAATSAGVHWSQYYHLAHTFQLTPTSYIYYIFQQNHRRGEIIHEPRS